MRLLTYWKRSSSLVPSRTRSPRCSSSACEEPSTRRRSSRSSNRLGINWYACRRSCIWGKVSPGNHCRSRRQSPFVHGYLVDGYRLAWPGHGALSPSKRRILVSVPHPTQILSSSIAFLHTPVRHKPRTTLHGRRPEAPHPLIEDAQATADVQEEGKEMQNISIIKERTA